MSVDTEQIIGFTVTLKKDLTHEDFKFFHSLEDKYEEFSDGGEYSQWCGGIRPNKVVLITDGMCGEYARLVYIEHVQEVYVDEDKYLLLHEREIPQEVYDSLNKAYQMIYNEPLDKKCIEYALWYYWH